MSRPRSPYQDYSGEQYYDYTNATSFERMSAVIQQTVKAWQSAGLHSIILKGYNRRLKEQPALVNVQAPIPHKLPWRPEPYLLQLHLPTTTSSMSPAGPRQQKNKLTHAAATESQASDAVEAGLLIMDEGRQSSPSPASSGKTSSAGSAAAAVHFSNAIQFNQLPLCTSVTHSVGERRESRKGLRPQAEMNDNRSANRSESRPDHTTFTSFSNTTAEKGGSGVADKEAGSCNQAADGWEAFVDLNMEELASEVDIILNGAAASETFKKAQRQAHAVVVAGQVAVNKGGLLVAVITGPDMSLPATKNDDGERYCDIDDGRNVIFQREEDTRGSTRMHHHDPAAASGLPVTARVVGTTTGEACSTMTGVMAAALDDDASTSIVALPPLQQQPCFATEVKSASQVPSECVGTCYTAVGTCYTAVGTCYTAVGTCYTAVGGVTGTKQRDEGHSSSTMQLYAHASGPASALKDSLEQSWWPGTMTTSAVPAAAAATQQGLTTAAAATQQGLTTAAGRMWWVHGRQHKLQRWFGLDHFLLLQPQNYSRRFMNEEEANVVLSSASCALHDQGLTWPLLLPIHNPERDAYCGVVVLPNDCGTLHLSVDCMHASHVNEDLLSMEGQLRLFADSLRHKDPWAAVTISLLIKNQLGHSSSSSCSNFKGDAQRHAVQISTALLQQGVHGGGMMNTMTAGSIRQRISNKMGVSASCVYRFPNPEDLNKEADISSLPSSKIATLGRASSDVFSEADLWDGHSSWHPWACQHDPINCIELDLGWDDLAILQRAIEGERQLSMENNARVDKCEDCCQQSEGLKVEADTDWEFDERWGWEDDSSSSTLVAASRHPYKSVRDKDPPEVSTRCTCTATRPSKSRVESKKTDLEGGNEATTAFREEDEGHAYSSAGCNAEEVWRLLLPPSRACHWSLHVLRKGLIGPASRSFLGLISSERRRQYVDLQNQGPDSPAWLWTAAESAGLGTRKNGHAEMEDAAQAHSFSALLSTLVRCSKDAGMAPSMGDLASSTWWEEQGVARAPPIPPGGAMEAVLMDLFKAQGLEDDAVHCKLQYKRTAPLGSLLSQLALHCLVFGNARAIAELWRRAIRVLRTECWEECQPLPRMPDTKSQQGVLADKQVANPDQSSCLLHQKLQMLQLCIHRRKMLQEMKKFAADEAAAAAAGILHGRMTMTAPGTAQWLLKGYPVNPRCHKSSCSRQYMTVVQQPDWLMRVMKQEEKQRGSVQRTIRHPEHALLVPLTQPLPVYTEDRLAERMAVLDHLMADTSPAGKETAQRFLHGDVLASRMSAFKATNPGAVLQDFIKWHSAPRLKNDHGNGKTATYGDGSSWATPTRSIKPAHLSSYDQDRQRLEIHLSPYDQDGQVLEKTDEASDGIECGSEDYHDATSVVALSPNLPPAEEEPRISATLPTPDHTDEVSSSQHLSWNQVTTPPSVTGVISSVRQGMDNKREGGVLSNWSHPLWESVEAVPAWEQKPLQDPLLEGERVLHDLETVSPKDLFTQLLAVGMSSAVQLLEASKGARLEPVQELIHRFHGLSVGLLAAGCQLAGGGREGHEGSWQAQVGHEDSVLELLLAEFHFMEKAVVLGESLVLRLPGCHSTCEAVLKSAIKGQREYERPHTSIGHSGVPVGLDRNASQPGGHLLYRSSTSVDTPEGRLAIASALCSTSAAAAASLASCLIRDGGAASDAEDIPWLEEAEALAALQPARKQQQQHQDHCRYRELMQCLFEEYWPAAGLREWVYTCTPSLHQLSFSPVTSSTLPYDGKSDVRTPCSSHFTRTPCNSGLANSNVMRPDSSCSTAEGVVGVHHRMYVQHGEGELRVALNLLHV
ncbi:hypothetical protein CEUSTIGMA_g6748.t1 [Chlamydomonas eustigma]|uniref:Rab3 GTPase-activating protein catalytic subunit n=1 Tax=Chlamydomonas eustigma TaxID=1157962 RepID=A0A250X8C0_9CHLO|nr:hypothetical protein CEUSTIGMA_g6748.t1 [Chlamydomonas eustigma]|eukprot:GAX79307.1 hypothetical protein CEUSTIGMA_g6748.t1 [Chlamydomonas eustigma]